MALPRIRNSKYLPRKTLKARHRIQSKSKHSNFQNRDVEVSTINFDLEQCTVQPTKGQERQNLPEGVRDKEQYKVFTNTPISGVEENYGGLGDQVLLNSTNGKDQWYTIFQVRKWQNGVMPHYQFVAVKDKDEDDDTQ